MVSFPGQDRALSIYPKPSNPFTKWNRHVSNKHSKHSRQVAATAMSPCSKLTGAESVTSLQRPPTQSHSKRGPAMALWDSYCFAARLLSGTATNGLEVEAAVNQAPKLAILWLAMNDCENDRRTTRTKVEPGIPWKKVDIIEILVCMDIAREWPHVDWKLS